MKDRPHGNDSDMTQFVNPDKSTSPMDATIVFVWNDTCVNLLVVDHMGNTFKRQKISINCYSNVLPRAEWVDYQKGQAAKAEHEGAAKDARIKELEQTVTIQRHALLGRGYTEDEISKLQASAPSPLDGKR